MNLEYKILWFENESDWFDSIIDDVKEIIEDVFGFKFVSPTREIDDRNFDNLRFEDYDLVLMDYNLENAPNGDTIIQRLRDNEIYTDVVFYSSRGEYFVRERMKENGIDGVYCVSRDSAPFIQKVQKIIQTTIKKVQDINNMRGLVMAEVAELDNKMIDILKTFSQSLERDEREKFIDKRKKKVIKSLGDKTKKIDEIFEESLFEQRDFETYQKWRSLQSIVSVFDDIPISETLEKYYSEIIDKRNKLAHVRESIDENGNKSLKDGDFIFDDDVCKTIRKDLQIHAENFSKILDKLTV